MSWPRGRQLPALVYRGRLSTASGLNPEDLEDFNDLNDWNDWLQRPRGHADAGPSMRHSPHPRTSSSRESHSQTQNNSSVNKQWLKIRELLRSGREVDWDAYDHRMLFFAMEYLRWKHQEEMLKKWKAHFEDAEQQLSNNPEILNQMHLDREGAKMKAGRVIMEIRKMRRGA